LSKWPYRPENPDIQDRIITSLERQRNFEKAMKERETFTSLFGKGSEWEKRNRNKPKALKKARDYDEQMLIQAAIYHHNEGKRIRLQGIAATDAGLLRRAQKEYGLAATAYQRYLKRFPNTKNSYELGFGYASCLYFSNRYAEAAVAFEKTRDSNLDNRYQKDAALYAIKSYEEHIKTLIAAGTLKEPPLPTAKSKGVTKIALPEPFKKLQGAFDTHAKLLPKSPATPRMAYKAAEISYRHIQFDDARKRFEEIYQKYCGDPMAINAAQAVLVTYQLAAKRDLDNMEKWAKALSSGKCGGKAGSKHKAGATQLLQGIKFIRAQKLFKKAEDLYKAGKKREAAPWYDKAAAAYLSLVDAAPNSSDADKALFNAGVAYEKSMRFDSATKIYERVWQNTRTASSPARRSGCRRKTKSASFNSKTRSTTT
jgi:tetratricopeptide (TPR) repeat protein